MYEYIKGTITGLSPTSVVVDAGGVGYLLNISLQTYTAIGSQAEALLYVHHIVREDAQILYGFVTKAERELFRLLISVSGIGAGTARVMLSAYGTQELINHIAVGNVAAIKSVKGIGIKTAERAIIDLKAKVLKVLSVEDEASLLEFSDQVSIIEEAVEALMILGYTRSATEKVIKAIHVATPTISVEDMIRQALSRL